MAKRQALLVGSMPYESEEAAMSKAMAALGPYLFSMPDGEVGEKDETYPRGRRIGWVQTAIQANVDSGAFEIAKNIQRDKATGLFKDYEDLFDLKPKYSPKDLPDHISFGYVDFFHSSYPIFQKLRKKAKRDDMVFQVGIPTGLAIAFLSMKPLRALRYRSAFDRRLATEANQIVKEAGDDVIIQIEVPIEMGLAQRLPGFMMFLPVNMLIGLVKRIDPNARIGIHMCLGDLHNKALIKLDIDGLIVRFANQMLAKWPATHKRLEYVHFPFAEGEVAPPTDPAAYAPLRKIHLPGGTRFIAGFVHESLDLDAHGKILKGIEDARGGPVDVACSCGLGRRQPEAADQLMAMTAQVAEL